MSGRQEGELEHVLTLVESAQRAGRSEREIVEIVDRYFGEETTRELGIAPERGVVRRLFGRPGTGRAA